MLVSSCGGARALRTVRTCAWRNLVVAMNGRAVVHGRSIVDSITSTLRCVSCCRPLSFIRTLRGTCRERRDRTTGSTLTRVLVGSHVSTRKHHPVYRSAKVMAYFIGVKVGIH